VKDDQISKERLIRVLAMYDDANVLELSLRFGSAKKPYINRQLNALVRLGLVARDRVTKCVARYRLTEAGRAELGRMR
jgi:DNA-binding HxlR family transcriptional regulator